MKGRRKDHPTYTTGEVAALFDVAARTVSKWCDSGKLACHRLPAWGSGKKYAHGMGGDRRILRADLVAFARRQGFPLALLGETCMPWSGLVVSPDGDLVAALTVQMPGTPWESASDPLEIGLRLHAGLPDLAVVDFSLGRSWAVAAVRQLRCCRPQQITPVVALPCEDDCGLAELVELCADVIQAPWQAEMVAMRVKALKERAA